LNNHILDYADKSLIHSIQQLLVNTKASQGLTNQFLDGGEGKTARNYLSENYLIDMAPLHQRTIESLHYMLRQAQITEQDIHQYHQQRLDSQETDSQKNNTQQANIQQSNHQHNTYNKTDIQNQTNIHSGGSQSNVTFNGGTFGNVITGNNTVNVEVKN
jgi:hypothetical protein